MEKFIEFIVVHGVILFALFYGATLLIALLQQNAVVSRLMDRMAANQQLGLPNVYAAIGGALTPFCSCSTVPVLSSMLRTGIRFGVCFTFLMASPLVNEAVVVVMWRYFGIEYMLLFIFSALLFPILVGILFDRAGFANLLQQSMFNTATGSGSMAAVNASIDEKAEIGLKTKIKFAANVAKTEIMAVLPYLLVGLLVGGLIYGFVPDGFIGEIAGQYSELTLILIMAALGVPLYFNITLVLPVAFALAEKGLGLGPITAFLVAGAGTSLPEMILLLRMFKIKLLIAYVMAMFSIAILMGLLFSMLNY
ncbi:MAG: permease [Pseudomonadota bacterium]